MTFARLATLLAVTCLATPLATPVFAQSVPTQSAKPAPIASLVRQVNIPHKQFTLKNGLRVIVHTDRKAPIVAVSVWYDVGSKHEPAGKTGFAHLFEHLMFGGSENVANFDEEVIAMGGANNNGTTWFDRTNYFETVPTGALDRMLYIESDRMGHLLGAVTQEKLDAQRGVVQNEKRQGDNQPFGLVEYAQLDALYPAGHPYAHSTIGSMADLDAASMEDVRGWFRQHYGPNNAVLVLAGDVDVKTARKLVTRWFGAIPRGPQQKPISVPVPTLSEKKTQVMQDRVANTRLYRSWAVPGLDNAEYIALDVAAGVLGGLASSRLDNVLVRDEQLAVSVAASNQSFAQSGQFEVTVDVKAGVAPAMAAARLDVIMADFIANGPSADEVQRVIARTVSGRLAGLEQVGGFGGKATALAEGALYRGDSNFYRNQLLALAAIKPGAVTQAMQKWLRRPTYALTVEPGERAAYDETKPAAKAVVAAEPLHRVKRLPAPALGPIGDVSFPSLERGTLPNGIELIYARRATLPITQMVLSVDAGRAADIGEKQGVQALMLSLLDEGAGGRSSVQIAEEEERLGANVSATANADKTAISLWALSANLAPSLDLFADIVRRPDFKPEEVARLKNQQLAGIAAELKQPQGLANRILPPILFGAGHRYGVAGTGTGTAGVVSKLTRDDVVAFHQAWIRPEKAKLFVVSDKPFAEIKSALSARIGDWAATGDAGVRAPAAAVPAPKPRIMLIDRPGSPQSFIMAGQVLPDAAKGTVDTLITANEPFGASFLSRLNQDLRETKAWSYGVRGSVGRYSEALTYSISAPVQSDRTGDSILALMDNVKAFLGPKGITAEEFDRTISSSLRELPGGFEKAGDVLSGIQLNDRFGRPDDYYAGEASRLNAMTRENMDATVRAAVKPDAFVWVVVGDAKIVKPQLEKVGLPVEDVQVAGSN
jgi:zinc protease